MSVKARVLCSCDSKSVRPSAGDLENLTLETLPFAEFAEVFGIRDLPFQKIDTNTIIKRQQTIYIIRVKGYQFAYFLHSLKKCIAMYI